MKAEENNINQTDNFNIHFKEFTSLSDKEFVDTFHSFNMNYVYMYPGLINYKFRNRITVGYLDILVDTSKELGDMDDNFKGLHRLKSSLSWFKRYATLRKYDKYAFVLIDINISEIDKFKNTIQFLINNAFNERDSNYYAIMFSIFDLMELDKNIKSNFCPKLIKDSYKEIKEQEIVVENKIKSYVYPVITPTNYGFKLS